MARRRYTVELRFADLDIMGHVNNVAYLTYLQEVRLKLLFDLLGGTLGSVNVVVARNEIDYLRPITLGPEPLDVETWIDALGTSSFTIGARILDPSGEVAATARTVLVNLTSDGRASEPLPAGMRALLETARDGDSR